VSSKVQRYNATKHRYKYYYYRHKLP